MDQYRLYQGPIVRVSGRNTASAVTLENVSELSSLITYADLGAAAKVQISSSSANDASAGTGARTVCLCGLDTNYVSQIEEINLNGQTQVESTKTFLRIFGAQIRKAGSGYVNVGDIYVIKTGTGGTVSGGVPGTLTSAWVKIPAGLGNATSGMFTVPAGKRYQLKSVIASARGQSSDVFLFSHDTQNTNSNALHLELSHTINTSIAQLSIPKFNDETLVYPIIFDEKTDIYLRCLSATANATVAMAVLLEQFYGSGR